jgi:hypothetical protein
MHLSKRIPARTKTVKFNWAYRNWMQCTEQHLAIRGKKKRRGKISMISCDWCGREFEIGEWFGIAQPLRNQEGPSRNWALCNKCCEDMGAPDAPKGEKQK